MYDLYLDDPQAIKCKAEISGAENSTKKVRLMVETSGHCLYFNGKVSEEGEIEVPMLSLKNILKESTKGKLMLEMVVDDTLFIPWETEFEAKLKKKVTIKEVKSTAGDKKISMITTPTATLPKSITSKKNIVKSINEHAKSIANILNKNNITYKNINENKAKVGSLIGSYVSKNNISVSDLKKIQTVLINNITEL